MKEQTNFKDKAIDMRDRVYNILLEQVDKKVLTKKDFDDAVVIATGSEISSDLGNIRFYVTIDFYFTEYELIKISANIDLSENDFDTKYFEELNLLRALNKFNSDYAEVRAYLKDDLLGVAHFPVYKDGEKELMNWLFLVIELMPKLLKYIYGEDFSYEYR